MYAQPQNLEATILYEVGAYDVRKAVKGYEVYKAGITHATRCAQIGWDGERGLTRAKEEADRRAEADNQPTATTTEPTAVIFRTFKNGDVLALFPYVIHHGYLVESYMHTGQHGPAAIDIISTTRPATPAELAPLMQELASEYKYNLAPIKRINYAKFRAAYSAARKY